MNLILRKGNKSCSISEKEKYNKQFCKNQPGPFKENYLGSGNVSVIFSEIDTNYEIKDETT